MGYINIMNLLSYLHALKEGKSSLWSEPLLVHADTKSELLIESNMMRICK